MKRIGLWNSQRESAGLEPFMTGSHVGLDPMTRSRAYGRGWNGIAEWGVAFVPPTEFEDRGTEIVVRCELPGVPEGDVHVTVSDHMLTLRGEKRYEGDVEAARPGSGEGPDAARPVRGSGQPEGRRSGIAAGELPAFSERTYGMFHRAIALPEGMDSGRAEANHRNGVIEIRIPRRGGVAPRQVRIKTNS